MAVHPKGSKHLADWPEGAGALQDLSGVRVQTGAYRRLGTIILPKGGTFLPSAAIRLPEGCWARWRFARIGWGSDPDGHDETGAQPLLPAPDGAATSYTPAGHPMSGGGPLAFEIKVYGPSAVIALPVAKLMAKRLA